MRKSKIFIPALLFTLLLFLQTLQAQNQAPAEYAVCSACHTIGKGKVIGPDLKGITERREEAWLISFIRSSQTMVNNGDAEAVKIFEEYKIPMPDNDFTDEQIIGILNYIKNYEEPVAVEAVAEPAPKDETATEGHGAELKAQDEVQYGTGNTQLTFIVFIALMLLAIIDLAFTRIVRANFIHIIVILVSFFVIGEVIYVEAAALGRQQGYSPDQPVWFSHQIHAGQNKIECEYCHTTTETSRHAGIPGTDVCMNCHNLVKKGAVTGEVEIAKVIESWNTGKPIEWVQVHNLPDHVYFNHAQHVNAGARECEECHGLVEEMDRVAQVEDLSMGWCIECHRTTMVQFENNHFYDSYLKLHDDIKAGRKGVVTVEDIGGTDCSACHY